MIQNDYTHLKRKNRGSGKIFRGEITLISLTQDPVDFGVRYLSSILKENLYNVNKIFLMQRMEEDISFKIVEQINEIAKNSLFIGVSIMTDNVILARKLGQKLKILNKDMILVGGGIHATVRPSEIIGVFDIAVRGEAEEIVLKLVNQIVAGTRIEDIKLPAVNSEYYSDGEIGFIKNIDIIPYPDFPDNFILKKDKICFTKDYKDVFGDGYSILTHRGCPYSCTYCGNNFFLRHSPNIVFRKRSISNIIDELKFAKENYKVKQVGFLSDNFMALKADDLEDFILQYSKEINLPFVCSSTPNYIKEDNIDKLVKIGLFFISVGVQSGSENTLKLYKRTFSGPQKILESANILHKFHPNLTHAFDFILDNPYETKEDIKETISLLEKFPRPYNLNLFSLTYYPGTYLYDKAVEDNFIKESYYLKNAKYYYKLNKSFFNSVFLLYALKINYNIIAFFMKCDSDSSKNIVRRVCKVLLENSTNILLGLLLVKSIFRSSGHKHMVRHYIKLGFSFIKSECHKKFFKRSHYGS